MPIFCIAQLTYPGNPQGMKHDKGVGVTFIHLEDAKALKSNRVNTESDLDKQLKINEFASAIQVSISPEDQGSWEKTDQGLTIWRIGFTSLNASSLSITFDPFYLKPGCKIFVYSSDGKKVLGAFTFRNIYKTGLLAISSIPCDSLIVELQLSSGIKDFGELKISSVSVGFPHDIADKIVEDEYFGWSADCHVDINCISDSAVQLQKYSTCRLVIENRNGRIRCTGTLLNNTGGDAIPYVLTAGHCIKDEYSANRTIVYFDYESPYCEGPDGEIKSISGSELRSRADNLDFALIELNEKPPVDFSPLYSGWDASGDNLDTCYSIHHPEGDVKKYCDNTDAVQQGSFSPFDEYTHWLIPEYNMGTTESGSSGAPLFDASNRLVGTLTGGGQECTQYIYDYYQRMSNSWFDYLASDKQLKHWLDPDNTGSLSMNNLDPFLGTSEQLSNIKEGEIMENILYTDGWGYISGHNSEGITQFAEQYYRNGSKYIFGIKMHVSKAFSQATDSKVILKVWEGDTYPDLELYRKDVYNFELMPGEENLIRLDTLILVNKHFFIGYEINYRLPIDTFALQLVKHNNTDSLNTAYAKLEGNWQPLSDGNQFFSASLAISPLVLDYYPSPDTEYGAYPFDDITIYPNPAGYDQQILFKNKVDGEVRLSVYDLIGNKFLEKSFISPEPNIRFETDVLPEGMFLLKIEYAGKVSVMKFIKFR